MPVFDPRQNALCGEPYDEDELEAYEPPSPPPAPNPFAQIRVPDKLGAKSAPPRLPLASLPPKPGQLYAYDVDRFEDGAEGYRQAYVQMLREVAPQEYIPPAPPPSQPPPMLPPTLYDDQADLGGFMPMALPQDAPYAGEPAPNTGRMRAADVRQGDPYALESAPEQAPARHAPAPRSARRQAPRSPLRVILTVVISLAILVCVAILASLIGNMQAEQQKNSEWRERYFGGEAAATGSLVRLPSGGATLAPVGVAAPQAPAATATPEPRIEIVDNLAGVDLSTPAPAASSRTARAAYQDNPSLVIGERFQALREQNRDVIGWLTLGELDCPVLQHSGQPYYDTHDASGRYSAEGAIYISPSVSLKTPPENLIVYGNDNPSGTMFAHLAKYEREGEEYLRKHPAVRLDTIYESGVYAVFAVLKADQNPASAQYFNYAGFPSFPTDRAFLSYVAAARRRSLYEIPIDVSVGDELLTLVTGTSGESALVVLCRRARPEEAAGAQNP